MGLPAYNPNYTPGKMGLPGLQSKLQDFGFTIDYQPAYIIMVILTRVNVGGVNNFAAGPLYGFTILLRINIS